MRAPPRSLLVFVLAVVGAAAIAAVPLVRELGGLAHAPAALWLLVVGAIIAEQRELGVRDGENSISATVSSLFGFALLLRYGAAASALGMVAASLTYSVIHRDAPIKAVFNVAQYVLVAAAGGATLAVLGAHPSIAEPWAPDVLLPVVAAAAVQVVASPLLTSTASALAARRPIRRTLGGVLDRLLVIDGFIFLLGAQLACALAFAPQMVPLTLLPLTGVAYAAMLAKRRRTEAALDPLTGLANRGRFASVLGRRAARSAGVVAVLDVQRFREVNETLGHAAGDELLRAIAARLTDRLAGDHLAARVSGNGFGVLVPGDGASAQRVAEDIRRLLTAPFEVAGLRLEIDVAVGAVGHPDHGADVATLLHRADLALHAASADAGRVAVWSPALEPDRRERLELVAELRDGLARDEVVAWFQPQVDLHTGLPVGAEALARWEHPARGMLPPGEFIALAERTNLIRPLTARIVECALAAAREWHDRGIDLRVAVNVSPRVLSDPDFPSCVEAALRRHGVAAGRLQLEVTESSLLTDPERSDRVVERLAALGVSLALDDFGTGYSSLAQLSGLPVDTLKVDRSFVAALDGGGGPIVRAMVDLAEGLDLDVIAEGIEEQPICAQLARMGCGIGQGYLFSRPLPADAFLTWVSEQRSFGARAA